MNVWLIVTLSLGFVVSALGIYLAVRTLQKMRTGQFNSEGDGAADDVSMAIIQKRSFWNILSMFIGICIMTWLFWGHSVSDFFQNTSLRISLTSALTLTLLVNLFLMLPTSKRGSWSKMFDERDELVLQRAGAYQISGILLLSVVWTFGLTEYYWDAGSIPIAIPYIMFWSNLLMVFFSRSIGIVYGYWWIDRYGN
ncbi:MAG: hypothetical protein HOD11_02585 [Candidatus Marinimicrobia bacterium]|nr:hypothetical protein [Candidatus Neomarinimicrobiota bacterium]